jgi:hypothetical protein
VLFPEAALQPFFFFSADDGAGIAPLAARRQVLLQFVAVYWASDALAVVFSSALRGAGTPSSDAADLRLQLDSYGSARVVRHGILRPTA